VERLGFSEGQTLTLPATATTASPPSHESTDPWIAWGMAEAWLHPKKWLGNVGLPAALQTAMSRHRLAVPVRSHTLPKIKPPRPQAAPEGKHARSS